MGLARRRRPEILQYLERATGEWLECPVGIVAREKTQPPKTLVQEVCSEQAGVRVFVVHSEERLEYERGQRKFFGDSGVKLFCCSDTAWCKAQATRNALPW